MEQLGVGRLSQNKDPSLISNTTISISSEEISQNKQNCLSKKCTKKTLEKRLPCIRWIREYTFAKFVQDFIAGIAVGLTAVPQGIAYGTIAGLEPQYGLYSAFMGCIMYMIFGSCKDITVGPSSIMSLMVEPHVLGGNPDFAVLLTFITGCVVFVLGVLNLGFLVDFISFPVITGFTTAAVFTIGSAQVVSFLGIRMKAHAFLESWITVFSHIGETRLWDSLLGFSSLILLIIMTLMKKYGRRESDPTRSCGSNALGILIWFLTLARNALIVIIGTLLAWSFDQNGKTPFILTGPVAHGLPPFHPPPFSTMMVNETGNYTYNFLEMTGELGVSMISIPMIGILEIIAIGKAFSNGKTVDATQELLALGMSNIASSFVRSMPITGAFSRSAVNNASGVQTTFGGVFTAALVLLALGFLTSTFQYIPKATLAAVIINAMIFMLDVGAIKLLWNTKKIDFALFLLTTICCLFISLEYGILIGILINILFILYRAARPRIQIETIQISNQEIMHVVPTQSLLYPAADYVRKAILKECNKKRAEDVNNPLIVVMDGQNVHNIDATIARNLRDLADDLQASNNKVVFWRWNKTAESECRNLDVRFGGLFLHAATIKLAVGMWEDQESRTSQIDDSVHM